MLAATYALRKYNEGQGNQEIRFFLIKIMHFRGILQSLTVMEQQVVLFWTGNVGSHAQRWHGVSLYGR